MLLPTGDSTQPNDLVRDPVCSTLLEPQQAYGSRTRGRNLLFLLPGVSGCLPERSAALPDETHPAGYFARLVMSSR